MWPGDLRMALAALVRIARTPVGNYSAAQIRRQWWAGHPIGNLMLAGLST